MAITVNGYKVFYKVTTNYDRTSEKWNTTISASVASHARAHVVYTIVLTCLVLRVLTVVRFVIVYLCVKGLNLHLLSITRTRETTSEIGNPVTKQRRLREHIMSFSVTVGHHKRGDPPPVIFKALCCLPHQIKFYGAVDLRTWVQFP